MLSYKTIYVLIIAALAMVLPLPAQNYGEITGTTIDPTGAVVIAATVTVVNTATNVARTVQPKLIADKRILLSFLPPLPSIDIVVAVELEHTAVELIATRLGGDADL